MKHLILITSSAVLMLFLSSPVKSQDYYKYAGSTYTVYDMGMGLGNAISCHVGGGREAYFGMSAHCQLKRTTWGEENQISWDCFSDHHVKEGSYHDVFLLKLGNNFGMGQSALYINVGASFETKYRNCYDPDQTIGYRGKYYKTIEGDVTFAYGAGAIFYIDREVAVGIDASFGKFTSIALVVYWSSRW
ncbi:hypothetical protein ACFLU5_15145 [Bacteroidota bacterium]